MKSFIVTSACDIVFFACMQCRHSKAQVPCEACVNWVRWMDLDRLTETLSHKSHPSPFYFATLLLLYFSSFHIFYQEESWDKKDRKKLLSRFVVASHHIQWNSQHEVTLSLFICQHSWRSMRMMMVVIGYCTACEMIW